jgi:hypothetical protein
MVVAIGFVAVELRDARRVFDLSFTNHCTRKTVDDARHAAL